LRPKNASFCSTVIMLVLFLVIGDRGMSARAETFPSRQVTIISPYQAGGTSDIIARSLARKLGDLWRQTVIVENRPAPTAALVSMRSCMRRLTVTRYSRWHRAR